MNILSEEQILNLCILSLLCKDDLNGYELSSLISKDLNISSGKVYPALRELVDRNCVSIYFRYSDDNIHLKYYRVTDQGLNKKQELENNWMMLCKNVNNIVRGESQND